MVFGHNLRYMAPFDFSRAGFCMVFRRASFVFSCPGTDFGGRGRILEPRGRHFGPGTFFEPILEARKHIFAREWFCGEDSGEFVLPKRILWSPEATWAGYFAPKPY